MIVYLILRPIRIFLHYSAPVVVQHVEAELSFTADSVARLFLNSLTRAIHVAGSVPLGCEATGDCKETETQHSRERGHGLHNIKFKVLNRRDTVLVVRETEI